MASQSLPIYNSDSDSERENSEPVPAAKKPRGEGLEWRAEKTFQCHTEAKVTLKSLGMWTRTKKSTQDGEKIFYDCKFSRECSAKSYLLLKPDSGLVDLYVTTTTHNHIDKPKGLDKLTKVKVDQLYADGITKPKMILRRIQEDNLKVPTRFQ